MKTVLIIDDEPDIDHIVRQKFRRKIRIGELDFISARNGVEALSVLEQRADVSVALCDINMPQMDGITLLGHLRERFPLVKPVMISAYNDMANIRGAMNRGAFDFLTKPLELGDLEITLDRALLQAQRMQDTLRSLRENNILKMFVNEAIFRHLSQWKNEEQIRQAEMIEATVVFFDVCGFTRLSEHQAPEHVVELLDVYFDRIAGAVVNRHGFVDKFIGDAVMAVFREPEHPRDALCAAIAARSAVADAGRDFVPRFGVLSGVTIGIHSGKMLSCSVGARSLARFDYTVIGDAVNTAARLQEAAGPWQIFVSEITRGMASAEFPWCDRGTLEIKGKSQGLRVYEVAPLVAGDL